jgi:hypothetical protein
MARRGFQKMPKNQQETERKKSPEKRKIGVRGEEKKCFHNGKILFYIHEKRHKKK